MCKCLYFIIQVPLLFALMSRKKRKNDVGMFRAMKEKVGGEMKVQHFLADFELPVWQAVAYNWNSPMLL